jgi:hypothetical protein
MMRLWDRKCYRCGCIWGFGERRYSECGVPLTPLDRVRLRPEDRLVQQVRRLLAHA